MEELNPFQKSIMMLLKQLSFDNIRRYKGYCYKELKTPEGYSTRFWIPTESIHEFVYGISKEYQFDVWKNLTSDPSMYEHVINYLNNCKDPDFPEITKDANMRSYRNGIVITNGKSVTFYKYGFIGLKNIEESVTSCEYLDHKFPPPPQKMA